MDIVKMVLRESLSCETILRKAPNGDLIIISQCGGTNEPQKENREYLIRSTDNGETWSKPVSIYEDGRAVYITEVFVYQDEIWAFAGSHDGDFLGWDAFVLKSFDNGYTWQKYPPIWQSSAFYFVRGGINYNGNIIFPVQFYEVSDSEQARLKSEGQLILKAEIDYAKNGVLISSDGGKSFHLSKNTADFPMCIDGKRLWKWTEPTLAVLSSGVIENYIRADGQGFLYKSVSKDRGETWSEFVRTDIPNPNNKPKIINLPNGKHALINTPDSRIGFKFRHPLCVWISSDDMKTFAFKKQIVDFPGWLSYPDGIYDLSDGRIKFAFELNRHDVYFCDISIDE
ncbi:MAG: exo-alpha-sialidase [Clostridia bacterium]|nr:exo-alpha-sialidase [Clostridia bacterium]